MKLHDWVVAPDLESIERAHKEQLRDMENAIVACCCALQGTRDDDSRLPDYALELAFQLARRYTYFGEVLDLEQAADICRWGLRHDQLSITSRVALLDRLGEAVGHLWRHDRQSSHIDDALAAHVESSALRRVHDLDESHNVHCLGNATLKLAFSSPHPSSGLHEALALFKQAARMTKLKESRAKSLIFACDTIPLIFEIAGDNRFAEGLELIKEAMDLITQDDPLFGLALLSLGKTLWKSFQSQNNHDSVEDLKTALIVLRNASNVSAITSPALHRHATHILGWALLTSFEETGNLDHLDEAMKLARMGLATFEAGSVNRTVAVRKLQFCLRRRYGRLGLPHDLDESIVLGRMALDTSPPGDFERPSTLCFLASSLLQRYARSHSEDDLGEAMHLSEESITLAQDVDSAKCLRTLGEARLYHAVDISQNIDELHEAISVLRKSLSLIADDQIGRIETIDTLATALRAQAQRTKSVIDLEEAVSCRRRSLSDIPPVRPDYPHMQALLADDLLALHELANRPGDLNLCMSFFRDAVTNPYGNPRDSLQSGKRWIDAATRHERISDISEAHHHTIGLLPRLAYSGYDAATRLQFMRETPGLALGAANHALRYSNAERAIEFLEQGRSVLWSRALQHRYHFRDLPPTLSSQLNAITAKLERPIGVKLAGGMTGDWEMAHRRRLIDEFDSALVQIRRTPGFERYLLPKKYSALRAAAAKGPIVILLPGKDLSHAIIISPRNELQPLPLPITTERLAELAGTLSGENSVAKRRNASSSLDTDRLSLLKKQVAKKKVDSEDAYVDILTELWQKVVHPVINRLRYEACALDERPRLWWCPTGHFTFLPIHAAGVYDASSMSQCASDYVISSYTPTLETLMNAREEFHRLSDQLSPRLLLVGQPEAPYCQPLPKTVDEVQAVKDIISSSRLSDSGRSWQQVSILSQDATTKHVLEELPGASIVHLACHGFQNHEDPFRSGFVMIDGVLTASHLMDLKLPHAFFAFLSACESAMGDQNLPDETLHLAATMMFVGFKSVIGTMWSMNDFDGPEVATAVYRDLFGERQSDELDPEKIPRALDAVTRRMRQAGLHPSRWATYIHMGI